MTVNKFTGGNQQKKTVCKGAWLRLFINPKVVLHRAGARNFFSSKVSAVGELHQPSTAQGDTSFKY